MRVLVACEFSGVVRRAFRRRGHEAYSCDLLESEDGARHEQGALELAHKCMVSRALAAATPKGQP